VSVNGSAPPARDAFENLVLHAAMDLMECGWKVVAIAGVLSRDPAWLEREIAKEIAATDRGAMN
jgi:hypothetical protein